MRIEIVLSAEERRRCTDPSDLYRTTLLRDLTVVMMGRRGVRVRVLNERRMPILHWDEGEPWPPKFRDEWEALTCPVCAKPHVDEGERLETPHFVHTCVEDAQGPGCGHSWKLDRLVWGRPLRPLKRVAGGDR